MNKQIIVTQYDEGIEFFLQFLNDKKEPIDITDDVPNITFVSPSKVKKTAIPTVIDAKNGKVSYILKRSLTDEPGLWTCYWRVVDSMSRVTAQEALNYYVMELDGGVYGDAEEVDNEKPSIDFQKQENRVKEIVRQVVRDESIPEVIDSRKGRSNLNERLDEMENHSDSINSRLNKEVTQFNNKVSSLDSKKANKDGSSINASSLSVNGNRVITYADNNVDFGSNYGFKVPGGDSEESLFRLPNDIAIFTAWYNIGEQTNRSIDISYVGFSDEAVILPQISIYCPHGEWQSNAIHDVVITEMDNKHIRIANYNSKPAAVTVMIVGILK